MIKNKSSKTFFAFISLPKIIYSLNWKIMRQNIYNHKRIYKNRNILRSIQYRNGWQIDHHPVSEGSVAVDPSVLSGAVKFMAEWPGVYKKGANLQPAM